MTIMAPIGWGMSVIFAAGVIMLICDVLKSLIAAAFRRALSTRQH